MLPISFKFVALGAAHQLKGNLYRFQPSRTAAAPEWTSEGAEVQSNGIAAPMTDPSFWQDRYALVTLTFRKENGEQLVMNDAVVAISRSKNIVTTQMVGRNGTVKEYINSGDYSLRIAVGVQAMEDGTIADAYPEEGIRQLRSFFDVNEVLWVHSAFLELFEIDRIVITGFSLAQQTESNYQSVEVSALSDEDYNVYSTDY